jgi:hypothetical protein
MGRFWGVLRLTSLLDEVVCGFVDLAILGVMGKLRMGRISAKSRRSGTYGSGQGSRSCPPTLDLGIRSRGLLKKDMPERNPDHGRS